MARICCTSVGIGILCVLLSGVRTESWLVKAEEQVLVAQRSELEEANALYQEGIELIREGSAKSLRQAIETWKRALPLFSAASDRESEAITLNNIGFAYDELDEKENALLHYEQALPLLRIVEDRASEARTLSNIGGIYEDVGEREQALSYYEQSLLLSREVEDKASEATTLNNLGFVYNALDNQEKALYYYEESLALNREIEDKASEARVLNNIGLVYAAQDTQDAQETRKKALSYYKQALLLRRATKDRIGEAVTLNNIGGFYDVSGDQEKALSHYEQALALLREVGDRTNEAYVLGNIAALHQQQGKLSDALTAISKTIDLIEDLRLAISPGELRAGYFSTVQDYYQTKIDIQMQIGQPEAAFETSESARARVLTELLNESRVDIRRGVSSELLEQERSLRQELAQIEQQRIALRSEEHTLEQAAELDGRSDSILQQLDQVITQIRRTSPSYAELVEPQPLTLTQIQQQVLDSDTVLLQYALGEERSYLWIVGQNHFQAYTLPAQADIQSVATQFRSGISSQGGPSSSIKRIGDELTALILPERPDWLTDKRLLISGDGILSELSFAALPVPDQTDYVPLLAEHELLTQPSITAISVLREQLASRQRRPVSLAVLADPVYRADDDRVAVAQSLSREKAGTNLLNITERNLRDLDLRAIERLPHTRAEANNILQLARQNNLRSTHAFDFNANIDWLKAPELSDYSLLHIATHGFVNPASPQLSGLALTLVNEQGQPQENGFLRLHDIFNLDIAAELVVLSACQTGRGKAVAGEGVIGLSRGFMYAGAKRIAVSLWNVNDEATSELMSNFYQYLLEDELTPSAAMRTAQLDAWRSGQNPYLWAAFTLQGEWQP